MASDHGFRIFVIETFKNQKKDREAEEASFESDAATQIVGLIEDLAAKGTQFLQPTRPPAEDEPRKPIKSVTIGQPHVVANGVVHLTVSTGEQGSHRRATRSGVEALPIKEYSPEVDHFMTLVFPNSGQRFLLVAHTYRQRDASSELIRMLTQEGILQKKAALAADEAARDVKRAAGERLGLKPVRDRLLFEKAQAADTRYLDEIIADARSASAVFEARISSDRGGRREPVKRRLVINLLDERDREIAKIAGRKWTGRTRRNESSSQAQGVAELADLLAEQDLLDAGEEQPYNHAVVKVSNPNGGTTIAVDTLRDFFTYPVSDGEPSLYYYYDKVADRLRIVAREERIDVDAIDAMEMSEWLRASTSETSITG